MAKLAIKKASTDVTTYVFIQDSSKTTGEGLAGLAYNTGSLVGYYVRPKGSATAITLATQTVTGDHSDGGFVEIDATNMPGVYRLDLPDAVCATGVPSVVVMLKGAANMSPVVLEIQLTDFDLNTAAITAAGIADAVWDEATTDHTTATSFGSLDANVDAILADTGTDGVVLKAAGLADDAVAEIADGVWDEAIAGHTTTTTFGGKNQKVVPSETINDYKADVSALTNVKLAADQSGVTIPAVTTVTNLTNAPTNGDLTATMKSSITTAASSATPALSAAGVDAILDEVVVGSYTMRQLLTVMSAALAGKLSGGGTTTLTFRGINDASDVVVATVDASGNRSALTITV